ncbi:MAG: pyridoxal phosphate-dependent aminotransferase [Nitrospiraceae bacterium]|nr:MAG: pyridoxal phosphate-dependent aminotransferase [Nitrospiraceae bacterium]
MRLAERTKAIKPSPTLAMNAKASALKAAGVDVTNFGVGEPDFDTPENIKEAAIKALRDGFTKYTPVDGIPELKTAIIEKFKKDNGLHYEKDEILVSCGAKHSLYNIAEALFGPGDEVIIPAPYWVTYPDQVLLNDATPVIIETDEKNSFVVTPELLREKITSRTKALILNSPSNPTGLAYDRKSLEQIAKLAVEHDFYIISDEIYEKLVYDGFEHISIASLGEEIKQRTIVVNGLSKSHAMTGWRIGFTAGPKDITKAMTNIQSQSTSNATSIVQKASVEALKGPQDFIQTMLVEFDKRRKYMVERLNAMKGVTCKTPVGAFYAFPNVSSCYGKKFNGAPVNDSLELSTYLLEQGKVALVPGSAFGDDKYIRLSYATSMENVKKGLDRIEEALGNLK